MRILYKQSEANTLLYQLGVQNCYLKHLIPDNDASIITKKPHYHTEFEIHIILEGCQTYHSENTLFSVEKNTFFLIPPLLEHSIVSSVPHTSKYSLTFECTSELITSLSLLSLHKCMVGSLSKRMIENLQHITEEYSNKKKHSALLIENAVFEMLLLFFRYFGLQEDDAPTDTSYEDFRLTLAKKYIHDNIKAALSVSDVADYCHISTKQLTRIFKKYENITPAKYIQTQRIKFIELLLIQNNLTLKEISEQMNFTNEYYFNTFFCKYAGMTPSTYSKMFHQ